MKLEQYDSFLHTADWLKERDLPVALTLIETLEPASGKEAIIFPPTYARRGGEHPYAITRIRENLSAEEAAQQGLEANICDLDSVGSQANRMEPAFKRAPLSSLVPQVYIRAGVTRVSLLDAGHRIADGAVRFSGFEGDVTPAILALKEQANAGQLARLAPTSLLFGFWDSRGSQYKYPRVLSSTIRAANVAVLKRSAQFNPAFDPAELKLDEMGAGTTEVTAEDTAESDKKADPNAKNPLSQQGMLSAPAVDSHGGVRVFGRIIRRTEINLVALRGLAVTGKSSAVDEGASLQLRRYLLGLALVAARTQAAYNLRQGCLLVGAEDAPPVAHLVFPSGKRENFSWDFQDAFNFATAAAKDFAAFSETPSVREFDFQHSKLAEAMKTKEKVKAGKKAKN